LGLATPLEITVCIDQRAEHRILGRDAEAMDVNVLCRRPDFERR